MTASSNMSLPNSILVFNQIVEHVARCAEKLAGLQPLARKREDDMRAIRAKISTAWERIPQTSHAIERDRLQAEIQGYFTKLRELEQNYDSGLGDTHEDYEHQADIAVKALCEALDEAADTLLGSRSRRIDGATENQKHEVSLRQY